MFKEVEIVSKTWRKISLIYVSWHSLQSFRGSQTSEVEPTKKQLSPQPLSEPQVPNSRAVNMGWQETLAPDREGDT